jgi:hypothetical protein
MMALIHVITTTTATEAKLLRTGTKTGATAAVVIVVVFDDTDWHVGLAVWGSAAGGGRDDSYARRCLGCHECRG